MLGKRLLYMLLNLSSAVFICYGKYESCGITSIASCFPGFSGLLPFGSSFGGESKSVIDTFVSTFTQTVKYSDVLTDIFEISQITPTDFRKYMYDYIKASATNLGMEFPHIIADTAAKAIEDNFETLIPTVMVKVFANFVAKLLQSKGLLNPTNAASLAASCADALTEIAKKNINAGNPESKPKALLEGIEKYLISMDILVPDKGQTIASTFANEVKLAAMKLIQGW